MSRVRRRQKDQRDASYRKYSEIWEENFGIYMRELDMGGREEFSDVPPLPKLHICFIRVLYIFIVHSKQGHVVGVSLLVYRTILDQTLQLLIPF